MTANKKPMALDSRDDAPDLSAPEWREKFKKAPVRRGRPLSANPKMMTTLRLDADVLEAFRSEGPGWQSRINDELKAIVKRRAKKLASESASKPVPGPGSAKPARKAARA